MPASVCPNCNTPVLAGAIFCDECGYDLRMPTPAQAAASPPGAPEGRQTCPVCQHANLSSARFCENCGSQLGRPNEAEEGMLPAADLAGMQGESPPATAAPAATEATEPPMGTAAVTPSAPARRPLGEAHLLVKDPQGLKPDVRLDLPAGFNEVVIGREDAASNIFPEVNLEAYGAQEAGVSRRHARLSLQADGLYVEDLNTVNGTFLNRQKLDPGQPAALKDGDELRLGKLRLVFTSG